MNFANINIMTVIAGLIVMIITCRNFRGVHPIIQSIVVVINLFVIFIDPVSLVTTSHHYIMISLSAIGIQCTLFIISFRYLEKRTNSKLLKAEQDIASLRDRPLPEWPR